MATGQKERPETTPCCAHPAFIISPACLLPARSVNLSFSETQNDRRKIDDIPGKDIKTRKDSEYLMRLLLSKL